MLDVSIVGHALEHANKSETNFAQARCLTLKISTHPSTRASANYQLWMQGMKNMSRFAKTPDLIVYDVSIEKLKHALR